MAAGGLTGESYGRNYNFYKKILKSCETRGQICVKLFENTNNNHYDNTIH